MDVISFQKIFGLGGLECHIVEIWRDVTLVHGRTTECEDRARILETEFAMSSSGAYFNIFATEVKRCCVLVRAITTNEPEPD